MHVVWRSRSHSTSSGSEDGSSGEKLEPDFSEVELRDTSPTEEATGAAPGSPPSVPLCGPSGGSERLRGFGANGTSAMAQILGPAGLWSEGSEKHEKGRCRACRFVYTEVGCSGGDACHYCHLPHTDAAKNRMSMTRREHCRSVAAVLLNAFEGDAAGLRDAARIAASRSGYLRGLLEDTGSTAAASSGHGAAEGSVSAASGAGPQALRRPSRE